MTTSGDNLGSRRREWPRSRSVRSRNSARLAEFVAASNCGVESWSEPRMRRFQITISDLMIATLVSALVIASMLRPNALWAFVFQTVLLLFVLALIVRGLIHSEGNYALCGLFIGIAAMVGISVVFVSVATIGYLSGLNWPICGATVTLVMGLAFVPWIGAGVGWLVPRTAGERGKMMDR
jgi:hypothetical protein